MQQVLYVAQRQRVTADLLPSPGIGDHMLQR